MGDGLCQRQALNASSPAACQAEARLGEARSREVMSQDLGFRGLNGREALLDHARDLGVQFLSATLEQRVVGRVLYQRVLERIGRIRRGSTTKGQSRLASRARASSSWAGGIDATAAISS